MFETYKTAKRIINNEISDILNEIIRNHSINDDGFMMLLVSLSKLLIIKQDIVYKNKYNRTLTELFPINDLNDMVFSGIFKIVDTPVDVNRTIYHEKPINIVNIECGRENDSAWIIDNIRDSIAHNKFDIDYSNQVIHINNQMRLLICDVDFYWLIEFSFALNNNKIENSSNSFKLSPISYFDAPIINSLEDLIRIQNSSSSISDKNDVIDLIKSIKIYMYNIVLNDNLSVTDIQKIKFKINEFWSEKTDLYLNDFCSEPDKVINIILKELKTQFGTYLTDLIMINVSMDNLIKHILSKIDELNDFYKLPFDIKKEIIIKFITLYYYNYGENNSITNGLDNMMSIDFGSNNDIAGNFYSENPLEYFANYYCHKSDKLLGALYLLGTVNYALYKERYFDKFIDYNSIDISAFDTFDFEKPISLKNLLKEKRNFLESNLYKQRKLTCDIENLERAKAKNPSKFDELILSRMEFLFELMDLESKLTKEINLLNNNASYIKTCNYGDYLPVTGTDFFRHLRNALAHTWFYFCDNNPNLMERLVEIRDYNDLHELVYICRSPYKNWLNLFNSKVFEDVIKNHQQTFEHTKKELN